MAFSRLVCLAEIVRRIVGTPTLSSVSLLVQSGERGQLLHPLSNVFEGLNPGGLRMRDRPTLRTRIGDPIDRFAEVLKNRRLIDDAKLDAIKSRIQTEFEKSVEIARQAPQPTTDDLTNDVFA